MRKTVCKEIKKSIRKQYGEKYLESERGKNHYQRVKKEWAKLPKNKKKI